MHNTLIRFARNALSLILTGAVVVITDDPRYLIGAPLLNAACKYLRQKYGLKYLIF